MGALSNKSKVKLKKKKDFKFAALLCSVHLGVRQYF